MTKRLLTFDLILLYCIFFVAGNTVFVRSQEKAVEQIKRLYDEVGQKIELSEKGIEESTYAGIICNELVINKNDHVWPAVGIYQTTYKFYYDSAGTEEHHYPDRLRKVTISSRVSDRSYYEEYFFDQAGALMFYYTKPNEPPIGNEPVKQEQRLYFARFRLIRIVTGTKTHNRLSSKDIDLARSIMANGKKIKTFFDGSLTLPND